MSQTIVARECKHAIHVKGDTDKHSGTPDDIIFIKERIHYDDQSTQTSTRIVQNFKRPFWVTKKGFQNHQEKKEWEDINKVDAFESTQAGLEQAVKRALGSYSPVGGLRKLARSPYLYGTDISPTAIIKKKYMQQWPGTFSQNHLAVLDIETDVVHETYEPILVSVTFKNKAILAATKKFADLVNDYPDRLQQHMQSRIPEIIEQRGLNVEIQVVDNPLQAIQTVIQRCHQWQPDFLAIWNINFDIPKILETIKSYGGDEGDIFSDPSVPAPFRKAWYKEGQSKKVTTSGKEEPLHWVDRWHTFYCPASFYVIDQAIVFRILRKADSREPSYALDAILKKYVGIKKLKNEKADSMSGLEWHQYMQRHEPLEYSVYNLFDCISCEILDEKDDVGDLRQSISSQCEHSDYANFASQPRRVADDLHFKCLELGKVIAATSDDMRSHWDDKVVSISGWICTLPAHMVADNGLQIVDENEQLKTMIYRGVYDLDVASAYPNGEDILNCSKETTVAEMIGIEGVSYEKQRITGINLTAGDINATEICQTVMGAPGFEQLLEDFQQHEM